MIIIIIGRNISERWRFECNYVYECNVRFHFRMVNLYTALWGLPGITELYWTIKKTT